MRNTLYILLFSALLMSCRSQKVAFTSEIQEKYHFSAQNLKKIQFYTSDEIILLKSKLYPDAYIEYGKLVVLDDKDVERIIIPKGTPCVLEEMVDNSKFLFSFEYGANRVLLFGNDSGGYYSLMAKEWHNKVGEVLYTNKTYLTVNGSVFLNIKERNLRKLKARERKVKGRRITQ